MKRAIINGQGQRRGALAICALVLVATAVDEARADPAQLVPDLWERLIAVCSDAMADPDAHLQAIVDASPYGEDVRQSTADGTRITAVAIYDEIFHQRFEISEFAGERNVHCNMYMSLPALRTAAESAPVLEAMFAQTDGVIFTGGYMPHTDLFNYQGQGASFNITDDSYFYAFSSPLPGVDASGFAQLLSEYISLSVSMVEPAP